MKNTKKALGILAFTTLMSLASCGAKPGPTPGNSSKEEGGKDEKVSITFWHTMGKSNQALLDTLIKSFNQKEPNIEIKASSAAGGYDDLKALCLKNVSTHTLPTMAFCYPDHVAEYLAAGGEGVCVNLDEYINSAELGFKEEDGSHMDNGSKKTGKDDFVKAFWEEGCNYQKEGTYSVPFAKSTEALFYNKDVFDANGWSVPETWDQMWALCREIKATYPDITPLGYDSDSNLFITLSEQMGIPFTSSTGNHFLFNNAQSKAMMSDLKAKFDEGLFVTKGTVGNNTYTSTKFTSEELLMSIGSTGGTTYNGTDNFAVGVAKIPSYDLTRPAVISQGPSICIFNDATKAQREAAWKFYKHISTSENSTYYGVSTGYQPVRLSSYETDSYKAFINQNNGLFGDVAKVSSTLLDSYYNSPVFVGSSVARAEAGKIVSAVLLGTKSVDKAYEDAMTTCVNS